MKTQRDNQIKDVVLIGAGMMSATLGTLLQEVAPQLQVTVFEKLSEAGEESSNEWNNAGTGHAALCEMNYTKEKSDGTIDISKAIGINEQFQLSIQFWAYLVKQGYIKRPEEVIRSVPHISFVRGKDDVDFLRRRFEALVSTPLFSTMKYTEDKDVLQEWMPLMMENRSETEDVAATKMVSGTDVNFGELTRKMFRYLKEKGVDVFYNRTVHDLKKKGDYWEIAVIDEEKRQKEIHKTKFVFIGGGGGSLHLLQKSGIREGRHIGGFPVSGNFMVCKNEAVIEKHFAKVYGKAKVGAPPMSVPHLDTRFINGKKALLFGPFAGFSPRFLKEGSRLDLLTSVKLDNALTMIAAGAKEISLTKYLIQQLMLTKDQRMDQLREFVPNAKASDWELVVAGQRVQVIKDTRDKGRGTLQFGTEVVTSRDKTLAALLGASPGASTAVSVMLDVLERCFPEQMKEWEPNIKSMIPSYGFKLMENADLLTEVRKLATKYLKLRDLD